MTEMQQQQQKIEMSTSVEENLKENLKEIDLSDWDRVNTGQYLYDNNLYKCHKYKPAASYEYLIGQSLLQDEKKDQKHHIVPAESLSIYVRYVIGQKYIEGQTMLECLGIDGQKHAHHLISRLPRILDQIISILDDKDQIFTHYDLQLSNIMLEKRKGTTVPERIKIIDLEYAFCSQAKPSPRTHQCNANFSQVIRGVVTPGMYDPYIDIIRLLTNFFSYWRKKVHESFKEYFAGLEKKCVAYFQSIGLHVQKDPLHDQINCYLIKKEEFDSLIKIPFVVKINNQMDYIPIVSADQDLESLSYEELKVCLQQDPRFKKTSIELKDHVCTLQEAIDFHILLLRWKKHNLTKIRATGKDFRKQIQSYLQEYIQPSEESQQTEL